MSVLIVCWLIGWHGLEPIQSSAWQADYERGVQLIRDAKPSEAVSLFRQILPAAKKQLGEEHLDYAQLQHMLGTALVRAKQPREAVPVLQAALRVRDAKLGSENLDSAGTLATLGQAHEALHAHDEAAKAYTRCLAIRKAKLGDDHKLTDATLIVLAGLHRDRGAYDEAAKLYRQRLSRLEKKHGPDSIELAAPLDMLAGVLREHQAFDDAITLYRRNLALHEKHRGMESMAVAEQCVILANALAAAGQVETVAKYYERALAIHTKHVGPDDSQVANVLNDYANFLGDTGNPDDAVKHYGRCLAIRETKLGREHPLTAMALLNLGMTYTTMGRFVDAEEALGQARTIYQKRDANSAELAKVLDALAKVHFVRGQVATAETLYTQALAIREKVLGPSHPLVAESAQALGKLHQSLARFAKAEAQLLRAYRIVEERFGAKSSTAGYAARDLAYLYYEAEQSEKGRPFVKAALEGLRGVAVGSSTNAAGVLHDVAYLMFTYGIYDEAERFFRLSLARKIKLHGAKHAEVGRTLQMLGATLEHRKQPAAAAEMYTQAQDAIAATYGSEHIALAENKRLLGSVQVTLKQHAAALKNFDAMRRTQQQHVARIVAWLPEAEQLQYLKAKDEEALHTALSLALEKEPGVAEASATWVLNGKAVAVQALAQQALLARTAREPTTAKLARELAHVRTQLAHRTVNPPANGTVADQQRQRQLFEQREQSLAAELAKLGRTVTPTPWVELEAVRKKLPAKSVLLEVARLRVANFHGDPDEPWREDHYIAWVIPATGAVAVVDLGLAAPIDQAIHAVRTALTNAPQTIRDMGEPAAEKKLHEPLTALSKLVLAPLEPHTKGTDTWYIAPDANLWLIPWEMLLTKPGTYLVEQQTLRYLVSGRDLLTVGDRTAKPAAPLIIADPDYDLGLQEADAETRAILRSQDPSPGRSAHGRLALGNIKRLPGTALEAEAALPKLHEYAGVEPQLRTGKQALESLVKAAKSPAVLVLSTHGFFLPEEGAVRDHPLLRCGLLFAGCNDHRNAKPTVDDGVLTGLEVVGMDLRGTNLVVLSACETGLGDVRTGEGIAGLRQAFQLAGATNVLATLWSIPDRETALLMLAFYRELAERRPPHEALRDAQRTSLQQRRRRFDAAHPFYWAAFNLTGVP